MNKHHPPFVSRYALQNYSLAESGIIEASQNNYDQWYIDCSLENERPSEWDSLRITNLLKSISSYGVTPLLHGNYKVPLASDVEELRLTSIEYVKKEIDLAAKLNAPLIVHGSVVVEPRLILKTKKQALNNFLRSLEALKKYADESHVTLYLENLSNYRYFGPFHYIFTHGKEFEYILANIDLPFFLDVGHAYVGKGDPVQIFNQFHKRIVAMSFSNNNGERDQHLGLREGKLDYKDLLAAILEKNWKGTIAFETRGKTPHASIQELVGIYDEVKQCESTQ